MNSRHLQCLTVLHCLTPRSTDMLATPVPDALLISGDCTCCVPHWHTPHNSTVFICRGKSCHSLTELPEPLRPEPALCCCTRQGQAAKTTTPGFPVSPRDTTEAALEYQLLCVPAALHSPTGIGSCVTKGNVQRSQLIVIL